MNRYDFYFEQLVTQADMDGAFDFAEDADHAMMTDNGYTGIVDGLEVVENNPTPDLTVDVAAGVAYDQDGQRIDITAEQDLDLSVDSSAVTTAVSGGANQKWVSVFVAFDRVLSDPRVDGNGTPLQYNRAESFQFIVDQGAEAAAGTAAVYTSGNSETFALSDGQTLLVVVNGMPSQTVTFNTADFVSIGAATAAEVAAVIQADVVGVTAADDGGGAVEITSVMTGSGASIRVVGGTAAPVFAWPASAAVGAGGPSRPALRPDALLLADVLFKFGTTQIVDGPDPGGTVGVIDPVTRRQMVFVFNGSQFTIREGTITDFATAIAQEITNHIAQTGASHPADAISYDPTVLPIPAAWSALVATGDVQSAIDAIVDDLVQATGVTGADLIGHNPTGINWADGTPLAAVTVGAAIDEIVADLADATGPDGAGRIGFDPSAATGITSTNVAGALDELATEKGNLSGGNTWADTQTFSGLADFNGNVSFDGASWSKQDPDHNFGDADLQKQEYSEQYPARTATQTDDILVYSNTAAAAGILKGMAMTWEDNTNDSFVCVLFAIPFTKLSSSTPQIDNGSNFLYDISGVNVLQGASPTGASWSIVADTNTISLRLTHNAAGPTTRNAIAMWEVLDCALNQ